MKIYELRLKNCKCYEDKTINFQEGINFISGVNGAGKTTIIEAIGFVLFNHLPYNARQFIRDGKNSGEVQVLIEAKDERLYRVIRKFNKQSKSVKWEVFDEESEAALDELHGIDDVSRWIKENIGVDPEDSLEKIFQQVIAVNQGLFTAPFLETGANRKRIFDDILKVEGYREAFDKSKSLKRFIEGEEKELQVKIDYLDKEIEKTPAVEEETVKKIEEEKEKTKQYNASLQKKKEMEKKEAEWAKLKEAVETRKNKKKLLEQERTSLEESIQSLNLQKKVAADARKIVEETKEAYQRYQQNQKDLKKWEDKKREKDNLNAELEKKIKTYAAEEKGMEVEAENIKQREKELTEKRDELQKYKDKAAENLLGIEKNLDRINSWIDKIKSAGRPFDAVKNWCDDKKKHLMNAPYELEKIEELTSQIQEIQEKLKDLPLQEKELAALSIEIKKGEALYLEKSSLEARKKALKQNESHLQEGRCPIIQEECPSTKVAGDLSGFFAKELNEIESGLHEVKDKLDLYEKQKEKYEKLKATVNLAKEEEKRKAGLEKNREHKLKELRRLLASIPFKELSGVIEEAQSEHVKLESLVREINLWIESKEFISQEPYTCKGLNGKECLELINELKNAAVEDTGQIRSWLTKWDQLDAEVERWLERGHDEVNEMKQWLNHIFQDVKLRAQKIKQQEEYCLEEIENNDRQAKNVIKKTADLDTRRKKLEKLGDVINKIKGDLEQYAPVESMVDNLKKELDKDQEHYEKYKENQQSSERLEKIKQDIKEYQARAQNNTKKIDELSKELEQLLIQYEPEKHEGLIEELKEVTTRVTELNFTLNQMRKDIDSLKKQLEDLRKKKEEWEENQKKLLVKRKAGELAQIIRNTLKNAADPIAQVYRRHLSIQANEIYRRVSNENSQLEWALEYELQLKDNHHSKERTRVFKQLSGGEQMTAALAVRLALMQMLSDVKVGFFDEPTTNLDASRRQNLAAAIQNSTRGFDQLFVISHDDAFDALTENIIALEKDDGRGTRVNMG